MSRACACLAAIGLSILVPGAASARQIIVTGQMGASGAMPQPPRDATRTGTSRIRGRVVAADTGQPLRKAQVRVFSPELRENRSVSTDADGRYELKELPAGRYQVSVSKGSFVSLAYGQSRPFEAGKPLEILEGQTLEKVDFALPRGGIVAGMVVDEFGEPVADVRVQAMRYQYVQGRRQLSPAGRVSVTNDIGEYRIFGLAPSQYLLSATLQPTGGVAVANMMGGNDDRSGYAPTYYPGTPNAAEAQRVSVAVGQTLSGLNMALVLTHTARISGTAMDSNGKPFSGGTVMAIPRPGIGTTSGGQVRPDGSFTLSNIAPGEYIIMAMVPSANIGDLLEMAMGQATVAGDDVTGVQIVGQKSITASGRLIVDPAAAKSLQPASVRLMAVPAHPEENLLAGTGAGKVNDDFTFEIKTRPGLALLRLVSPPPDWAVKSVRIDGADVTDTGIDFKPNEDVTGLEVELTNKPTDVSGMVTNARNEPVKDYTVVVFAKERARWGYMSRFFRSSRPDQDGRYKVKALPAGEYCAVALDFVEPGEESDPEFLERVKTQAVSFSLMDGETKVLDLKLSSPPT